MYILVHKTSYVWDFGLMIGSLSCLKVEQLHMLCFYQDLMAIVIGHSSTNLKIVGSNLLKGVARTSYWLIVQARWPRG